MKKRIVFVLLALAPALTLRATAAEGGWPKELETDRGSIVVYQPQIERFEGIELEARAAVALKMKSGGSEPIFGAVWIEAVVDTDREARLVHVREIDVSRVHFVDATDEEKDRLAWYLEQQVANSNLTFSLDRLLPDMAATGVSQKHVELRHDPPVIKLSTEPAVLVPIDGEPIYGDIEGTSLQRVMNTPFPIIRQDGILYLSGGGDLWYRTTEIEGPWFVTIEAPAAVSQVIEGEETEKKSEGPPPRVIVATVPTELVVTDGEPTWSPVEGMDLLYVDNTDSDVFLEVTTQSYYVLLSGRWYRGTTVESTMSWEHVPNDKLPTAFSSLSPDSPTGHVLAHVAGTDQAEEAILDNTVPQTAAIRRDDKSFRVEYDGEPKFEDVDQASVQYAVNTSSSVFKVGDRYFACQEGVWYESSSATGLWSVATEIPDAIYGIPASNPHHNVTYVYVYDVTPEVVYVGYTPAYLGSHYYGGCVVYGTGWYYRPWYGSIYYPRPATWGFHVSYNPWTGWGVGLSWSNGPFRLTVGTWGHGGYYGHGWFGPAGYRPYYRPYVHSGFNKTTRNVNRNINVNTRTGRSQNLYDTPQNRPRNKSRPQTQDRQAPKTARNQNNNVLTDKNGNVYRRDKNGDWQQRENGQWDKAKNLDRQSSKPPGSRPGAGDTGGRPEGGAQPGGDSWTPPNRIAESNPGGGSGSRPDRGSGTGAAGSSGARPYSTPGANRPPGSGAARPQLEQDYRARNRGAQRSNNFQQQRSRGAGRSRGGGRGR